MCPKLVQKEHVRARLTQVHNIIFVIVCDIWFTFVRTLRYLDLLALP